MVEAMLLLVVVVVVVGEGELVFEALVQVVPVRVREWV